jgi:hypothetical protein
VVTRPGGTNVISEHPTGTRADTERIFDSLPLKDVGPISSSAGDWGRTETSSDGTTVTVRPSRTGLPILQIIDNNRPGDSRTVQEIRLGSSQ